MKLNMRNNHKLVNCDTDSITICKPDGSPFSEIERAVLLKEINALYPEGLLWEDDGYYTKFVVLKAKNYIMYDGKKIKTKGSGLKSSKLEIALKEFHNEIINAIIHETSNFGEIYNKYAKEIENITDIRRWSSKKTITQKVFESPRENEAKIRRAIQGADYVEGDKVLVFYLPDGELSLVECFSGVYDAKKLYKRLYDSSKLFANVIDTDRYFVNYSLKKNQEKLKELQ